VSDRKADDKRWWLVLHLLAQKNILKLRLSYVSDTMLRIDWMCVNEDADIGDDI
jgi:hypothetical protein